MASRQRTTLREVASLAGVSIGTASAVFTNNNSVSEEAKAAVQAAANELGYRHRRRPTPEVANGLTTIGLLALNKRYVGPANPFYGPVLHGVQMAAGELGLSVVLDIAREEDLLDIRPPLVVQRRQAQGLLLIGHIDHSYIQDLLDADVPCVLVDYRSDELPVDSVIQADEHGGYIATRHLIELGHRDPIPATITGPQYISSIRARLDGYHRALAEAGLKPDPDYVGEVREGGLHPEVGREVMDSLLDLPTPPTAVFCCNDATALGALEALRSRGIAVPEEFSVVGYDDISMASYSVPPLTTIAVDKELLGMQAVWTLVQRITRPNMAVRETCLRVDLLERSSTATRR